MKLDVISSFDESKNRRQTAKKEGCTSVQLRNWIKKKRHHRAFTERIMDIGYTWVDESPVSLRTLEGFVCDPTTVISLLSSHDDEGRLMG